MLRNYLKGVENDMIHTIMAAVAFNMKKRLRQIRDANYFVLDLLTINWPAKYAAVLIYSKTRLVKDRLIIEFIIYQLDLTRLQICLLSLNRHKMRYLTVILILLFTTCRSDNVSMEKIIFLHHSTGLSIWKGKTNKYVYKLTNKGDVEKFFDNYNRINKTNYKITERIFPKSAPYGWKNYPYDYYNIWVKNAGKNPYLEEPTLEILTEEFDVIIFKHCFPVSRISEDTGSPDIDSDVKSIENYKLQYNALKSKMHEFPENKFIVWTPAVNTKAGMTEDEARRTKQFYDWMIGEWDEKGDNIFIWDFYKYETEGGLYLADRNSYSPDNSHPGRDFAGLIAPLFAKYVIDVIESATD